MAYVDGFNLYHGMHEATGRRDLWLDLEGLLSHPAYVDANRGQTLVGVHYFTAAVSGPGATHQAIYLQALEAHSANLTIHRGRFQRKTVTCYTCGSQWPSHEEKESDVSLAVQLVADVARRACDRILLVSADADMCPAVREARILAEGKIEIVAIFPPKRRSDQLGKHVDRALTLYPSRLKAHQLPEVVEGPRGKLHRPTYWA
jgi:NYN domain